MTGRDFLPLAKQLAGGADEPEWRTATSRAYYAAFHVARNLFVALRFVVPHEEKAHVYLYHRLNNCGEAAVQGTANKLNNLRRRRNQADYDCHLSLTQAEANQMVQAAEEIIQALDNLSAAEQIQIRDAMIIYERDVLQNVTWQP
jgi:uncharacterized protein (UPF0332 family)